VMLVLCGVVESEDGGCEDSSLPPGVEPEDVDLFNQAQARATEALNKVGT